MKLLIVGGDGMLGHQLVQSLGAKYTVGATYRRPQAAYDDMRPHLAETGFFGIDAEAVAVRPVIDEFAPKVVVNAVGIVKQRKAAHNFSSSIRVNSLFPHELGAVTTDAGGLFVHISTDCVFSGSKGNYSESDLEDARELYGRSKLLGEVHDKGTITLRTSIIGLELRRNTGLVEWFLSQEGRIKGFTNAIYSGFTTLEFARIIDHVITSQGKGYGLYHASSDPISKFELLQKLNERLGGRVEIEPDEAFQCDRSLNSARFRRDFAYSPPGWDTMIDELADQIRGRKCLT